MKTKIFLLSIIFLIIFFSGCSTKIWPPQTIQDCRNLDETKGSFGHNKTECYTFFALKNNDKNICFDKDLLLPGECLKQFAVEKKDLAVCNEIPDGYVEINIFDKLKTQKTKDVCYYLVSTKNNESCELITDEKLKAECFVKTGNKSGIKTIQDKTIRDKASIQVGDYSPCYEITNLGQRADCLPINHPTLKAFEANSDVNCTPLFNKYNGIDTIFPLKDNESQAYINCKIHEALEKGNIDYCKELEKKDYTTYNSSSNCYYDFSYSYFINYCNKILITESPVTKDNCLMLLEKVFPGITKFNPAPQEPPISAEEKIIPVNVKLTINPFEYTTVKFMFFNENNQLYDFNDKVQMKGTFCSLESDYCADLTTILDLSHLAESGFNYVYEKGNWNITFTADNYKETQMKFSTDDKLQYVYSITLIKN